MEKSTKIILGIGLLGIIASLVYALSQKAKTEGPLAECKVKPKIDGLSIIGNVTVGTPFNVGVVLHNEDSQNSGTIKVKAYLDNNSLGGDIISGLDGSEIKTFAFSNIIVNDELSHILKVQSYCEYEPNVFLKYSEKSITIKGEL